MQLRAAWLPALLALLAVASLSIDIPVSAFFSTMQQAGPGELRRALAMCEFFGHGAGVLIVVIAVHVLDPRGRRAAHHLALCAYGAGFVNLLIKLTVGRTRPSEFWQSQLPTNAWDTFIGLFPAFHAATWPDALSRGVQSFPSGHSATAAGLAVGLVCLYPRGRWLFGLLALTAMMQRVSCGAHFPSDAFAGAAVGCLVAALCCRRWQRRENALD
jgi:membrane-associated phospholipid phosphatase